MLKILSLTLVALAVSISMAWMLDNNGTVVITWLGYEARTSILAAALITAFFSLIIFAFSYLLARILAVKFPSFFKLFFKRTYLVKLEKLVKRNRQAVDLTTKLLMALETKDMKASEKLNHDFSKLIKSPELNNFLLGKIAFDKKNYDKAIEFFSKINEDKYAKILVLKSKFKMALDENDASRVTAYAKQVLSVRKNDMEIVQDLLSFYKKQNLLQELRELEAEYKNEI
ncbi:MAG: hypothetical protein KGQ36_07000 [Rickettsiales bacterium]|nr:hypothetical protein [Rickettsiales bacterium]